MPSPILPVKYQLWITNGHYAIYAAKTWNTLYTVFLPLTTKQNAAAPKLPTCSKTKPPHVGWSWASLRPRAKYLLFLYGVHKSSLVGLSHGLSTIWPEGGNLFFYGLLRVIDGFPTDKRRVPKTGVATVDYRSTGFYGQTTGSLRVNYGFTYGTYVLCFCNCIL